MWPAVAGILAAITLGGVVFWIKGLLSSKEALDASEAQLQAERDRVAAKDVADAAARAARAKELDAKVAVVRTTDDAAKLLRDQFGSGGS